MGNVKKVMRTERNWKDRIRKRRIKRQTVNTKDREGIQIEKEFKKKVEDREKDW